jgi:2-oxoglutarate-Fe(II)-dependent oxygenase superfamily protein
MSGPLFEPDVPAGFVYRSAFLDVDEEFDVLNELRQISFSHFEMRGAVARRRVAFFGRTYEGAGAMPFPEFLRALRTRVADWADVEPLAFAMALINEYPPGAPIGWHRDAPQYDLVAGVSLLSSCRMRFRPYMRPAASPSGRRKATHEIALERRSAYILRGAARRAYEHHIPAVRQLRYSITFRTLKSRQLAVDQSIT